MSVSASTLCLRSIFSFEQELRVAHLLRKHFWSFPHLERTIYTYLVCFCQRTLPTIDIPFRARITNHTRFIESISAVYPRLERRTFTAFCLFQPAHFSYNRYYLSSKNYESHACYRKHFWCFPSFRTKNIHISCLFLLAQSSYDRYPFSSTQLQKTFLMFFQI